MNFVWRLSSYYNHNEHPVQPAILFDLDGTLVDTIQLLLESMQHAFEGRAHAPTTAEWIAGIGTPLVTQFRPFAQDDADLQQLTDRYRAYQRLHHDRLTKAFDGTLLTVRELHGWGYPLGIVTSKANDIAHRTLRHVGLAEYFDIVVGVESTTRHKPDPEPVRFALAHLRAPAEGAVFVGDSPHDIAAGNAAGVITVAALWGAFAPPVLRAANPHHELDRISGLPDLIRRRRSWIGGSHRAPAG